MDLSVIIVNHNSTELLLECIRSIHGTVPPELKCEVIVVDNASQQDPTSVVLQSFPAVQVLRSDVNEGFSRANNRGVTLSQGRNLLFLNPDMVLHEGTLSTMLEFLDSHPLVGAASCYVRLPTGQLDDAAHRGFPTPWNAFCHFSGLVRLAPRSRLLSGYSMGWAWSNEPHRVDAVAGCFMMMPRKAGTEIGWWDEDYFFYGEDLDVCFRLKDKGWDVYFIPTVSVLHYKGMSSGIKRVSRSKSRAERATRLASTEARFDAMKIFYRKHYAKRYPGPVRGLVLLGIAVKLWAARVEVRLRG